MEKLIRNRAGIVVQDFGSRECDCCGSPLPSPSARCGRCGARNVQLAGFLWLILTASVAGFFGAAAYVQRAVHIRSKG